MSVATSERAQKTLREHRRDLEKLYRQDLMWIMSDPAGRRFMYDLLSRRCWLFSDTFDDRQAGMRSVAVKLQVDLQEQCPEQFGLMITEQFTLNRREKIVQEAAETLAKQEAQDERSDDSTGG